MAGTENGGGRAGPAQDAFGAYLRDIRQASLLSPDEEARLAQAIQEGRAAARELEQEGDRLPPDRRHDLRLLVARCRDATRRFVEANLRLVVAVARRYHHPRLPMADLVQEGNLGLLQAVARFDPSKGYRFSTYATYWIRQAISRAIATSGRLIRLPEDAGDDAMRILRTRDALEAQLHRAPTREELAAAVGLPPARVVELLTAAADAVSTSERAGGSESLELGDLVADASAEEALERRLAALVPDRLEQLLAVLPDRERMVLCLRFGLDGHDARSRAAVGALLGTSGERVRQLEARALGRLRNNPEAAAAWRELAE